MIRTDLSIQVERKESSHDYKHDPQINSYKNNTKNNSIDSISLFKGDEVLFFYDRMQTVSNHPAYKGAYLDTIRAGSFFLECFVEPRSYQEEIHSIIDAYDIENQQIGRDSMQLEDGIKKGRWNVHSALWKGKDLDYCWSAGCLMFAESVKLKEFNECLRAAGIKPGDIIPGELVEVD